MRLDPDDRIYSPLHKLVKLWLSLARIPPALLCPKISLTRVEVDFVDNISTVVATDPDAGWIFVVDNLNIHCSEGLVRFVTRQEGIPEATLGIKGRSGILKSMNTRLEFLTARTHRIRFVYLPKHSS